MSRRRKSNQRACSSNSRLEQRRRKGWDMNLYRNTEDKKIAGVCSGLADHFTGSLAFFAYGAAWFLMAPRRKEYSEETVEYDEHRREYKPRSMFRYSENASARIKAAQERVRHSMERIEGMESYVTSRQYQLNKEFSKLAD